MNPPTASPPATGAGQLHGDLAGAPGRAPRAHPGPTPRHLATATISGLALAFPRSVGQAEAWETYFAAHFNHDERVREVWHRCEVQTRHHVVDPREESDLPQWGTERRMARYHEHGLALASAAARSALADAGAEASAIDSVVVVSSTGYGAPGIDLDLIGELGLRSDVQRMNIGNMGCYGTFSGFMAGADAAAARGQQTLVVCVELPSLHIQPAGDEFNLEQAIVHSLFSDGASAAVIGPDGAGLQLIDTASVTDPGAREMMHIMATASGLQVHISPLIPSVVQEHTAGLVNGLLQRNGIAVGDVAAWAVHPGGPAIVDAMASQLDAPADVFRASREVLRDHGNCSSVTAWIVLEQIRRESGLARGDLVMLAGSGPGFSLYAALLRNS